MINKSNWSYREPLVVKLLFWVKHQVSSEETWWMQLWKDSFNCKSYSSTDTSKVRRSIFISFGVIRNKSKSLFPVPEMVEAKSQMIRLKTANNIDNMIDKGQSYLKYLKHLKRLRYLAMFWALPHLHHQGLHCSWRNFFLLITKVKVNFVFYIYIKENLLFTSWRKESFPQKWKQTLLSFPSIPDPCQKSPGTRWLHFKFLHFPRRHFLQS